MSQQVNVIIPTALRAQVGNQACLKISGNNVGEVLLSLTGLKQRLFRNDNELNRFINVYLNDEDIRFLDHLQTPVRDGDELALVPAIAGG